MILSVENLCFSYGAHQVLQQVDFAVEKGEFLSILGPLPIFPRATDPPLATRCWTPP